MRWIIGDIHGMLRPLETLLREIERADPQRQLIFVGDYVNRGAHSRDVIDLLLSLPNTYFVRGNHDDVFDQVLCGLSYCERPGEEHRVLAFQWFMQHGMDKTFLSYGIAQRELTNILRRPGGRMLDELARVIPISHRRFIRQLPAVFEQDDLFVIHAKWGIHAATVDPPVAERVAAAESLRYALLWGRYGVDEIDAAKSWHQMGYFGHTTVDNYRPVGDLLPIRGEKMVLLDTACALSIHGRLTAWCHETGTFLQTDAAGKPVENASGPV